MNLISLLKKLKFNISKNKILKHDIHEYRNYYALSKEAIDRGDNAAREILVYCHVVEKGLSHKKLKPMFGFDRVLLISKNLCEYLNKGGKDKFIIGMAVSTLSKYNQVNRDLGVTEDKLIHIPEVNYKFNHYEIGVEEILETDYFSKITGCFSDIAKSRHSVRLYDSKSESIKIDEILECIEIAQNCPSACNRQAVKIKIVLDINKIKQVCDIQGGANGFGENAGAILIITSDISLYEPSERRIPMLDCGLFVMNLVYALYEKRFGTCILNASFTEEREKNMKDIVPIPNNEMYAAIIAVSKISAGELIKLAKSCKRDVNDIVQIL